MNGPPLIPELAEEGLLLQAAVKIFDLGDATRSALAEVGVELSDFRSLVLLAQAGSMFWDRQVVNNLHLDDPFDDRAMAVVESWFESTHPHASWQVVYPGPACLARNACPVGSVHHYGTEQMTHHYGAGLGSIRDRLDES